MEASAAQIHVSTEPLFSVEEMEGVIANAEREGLTSNGPEQKRRSELKYGKQVAIGTSIKSMPSVLTWFNDACRRVLFPQMAALFPSLISDGSLLRAHGIVVLKYNSSQPQTDVHVDPALFAFTVALSPSGAFDGGGTYFEHINHTLDMPQGHVTFRPGSVRHAGAEVRSGLRYVIGGFISADDRVEHVRRLNKRGNKIALQAAAEGGAEAMSHMERALSHFDLARQINPWNLLSHPNLADVYLRIDRNGEAEDALRHQLAHTDGSDSDVHYSLGLALRSQDREAEAAASYEAALAIEPRDFQCTVSLAGAYGAQQKYSEEKDMYLAAISLRPDDVKSHLNLAVAHTSLEEAEEAEAAFRAAAQVGPADALPPLNLGRFLTKHARPAEAISAFEIAGTLDAELWGEVQVGTGTARAQQGRLAEAVASFEAASAADPSNKRLKASLGGMREKAEELLRLQRDLTDAAPSVCGTPCQDVIDGYSVTMCDLTWADGCGDEPPPDGFGAGASIAALCAHACAYSQLAKQ